MHSDIKSEDAILATQHQFWAALEMKSRTLFENVLAPDFVARSPGEPDRGRADFIKVMTSPQVTVSDLVEESFKTHIYGDLAVLTGVQVARVDMSNGVSRASRMMLTNVFRRHGDAWAMVLSHSVELRHDK